MHAGIRHRQAHIAPPERKNTAPPKTQKDPGWVAEALSRRGIAVRAGLHCAPLAHATGGTEQTGTVRVSVSAFNTSREITAFLAAMQALV